MVRIRRGKVVTVRARRGSTAELVVDLDDGRADAIAYEDLTGPVAPGDAVVLNTTAVALGLGTGGFHVVMAVEAASSRPDAGPGTAMKLRYSPVQTAVAAVEETHAPALAGVRSLDGMPVVVAGLHSALAPALIGIRSSAPRGVRTAYVMTDRAALHLGFSRAVPALREAGLLDATITAGQATGGELEAVTVHSALTAARAVAGADVVVVAMGPGNLGTASRFGFASLEVAELINAVAALGGRPIVAPRLSFADRRERHRGISHHTLTALTIALAPAEVALPPLDRDRAASVRDQLARAEVGRHRLIEVPLDDAEEAIRRSPVPLRSMGRGFEDDPDLFRAAAAAGVHAGRALAARA